MGPIERGLPGTLLVGVMLCVACGRDRGPDTIEHASFVKADSTRTLGPGDVRITNADSSVEIAIIGDSIVAGLADRVRRQIHEHTDTGAVSGSGFGASIEKMVKSTVASALDHQIEYSITDVQDVRYEDGQLRLYWKDGSKMRLFDDTHENGRSVSKSFRPDDAQRFIAAFKAKKASRG